MSIDVLKRVVTAAVSIPLFVWLVTRGPRWAFALLVVAVSGMALWELTRMFEGSGQPVYRRLGMVTGMALTASFAVPGDGGVPGLSVLVLGAAVAAILSAPVWTGERPATEPAAFTVMSVLYVGWFLGHGLLLQSLPEGADLVLFLVGVTWVGESAAYLVGSAVGRRLLAPVVSPRKTVEGAAAQVVASVAAAALLGAWLLPEWEVARTAAAGAVLGVVGQVGDLAESVMKRSAGVKDTGGLIPGHGGVLDRIDGLLFNAPALYYYVTLGGGR
jgi:phosphatidate cytidylyltransferase